MSLTDYLHGVQFVKDPLSPVPVLFARSSVIGLVGTAPMHLIDSANRSVNQLKLVNNAKAAAKFFGNRTSGLGFTIPNALSAIYKQRTGLVLVVNVWDKDKAGHKTAVAASDRTVANGVVTLPHKYVYNVVVKAAGGTGSAYVEGTDYTLDAEAGTVTRKAGGAIASNATQLSVAYDRPNLAGVTTEDIIGEVDATTGLRSGLQCLLEGNIRYGFDPRIIIAPGFSTTAGVATEMSVIANKTRGHYIADIPVGTILDDAIAARNGNTESPFLTSSTRAILTYPHVKDQFGDFQPYSQYFAGVMARTDAELGYWHSPDNKNIEGIVGVELPLTCSHTDPSADVQLLNASGICTIYGVQSDSSFASGLRTWGSRSAAFPSTTSVENFINMQRIEDQLHISLERAILQYIGRPINDALIETIIQTVRAFIRVQIGLGALIDGNCYYDPEDNPAEEIASGHLTFTLDFIGPPPLEKATFKSRQNITYLTQLGQQLSSRASVGATIGG